MEEADDMEIGAGWAAVCGKLKSVEVEGLEESSRKRFQQHNTANPNESLWGQTRDEQVALTDPPSRSPIPASS